MQTPEMTETSITTTDHSRQSTVDTSTSQKILAMLTSTSTPQVSSSTTTFFTNTFGNGESNVTVSTEIDNITGLSISTANVHNTTILPASNLASTDISNSTSPIISEITTVLNETTASTSSITSSFLQTLYPRSWEDIDNNVTEHKLRNTTLEMVANFTLWPPLDESSYEYEYGPDVDADCVKKFVDMGNASVSNETSTMPTWKMIDLCKTAENEIVTEANAWPAWKIATVAVAASVAVIIMLAVLAGIAIFLKKRASKKAQAMPHSEEDGITKPQTEDIIGSAINDASKLDKGPDAEAGLIKRAGGGFCGLCCKKASSDSIDETSDNVTSIGTKTTNAVPNKYVESLERLKTTIRDEEAKAAAEANHTLSTDNAGNVTDDGVLPKTVNGVQSGISDASTAEVSNERTRKRRKLRTLKRVKIHGIPHVQVPPGLARPLPPIPSSQNQ